jgi:hypothetical protein
MALLSTGVLSHAAHVAAPAQVQATSASGVHLRGGIVSGRGYVTPLGLVRGQYNLVHETLTLRNKHGAVELQLGQLHQSSHLVRFSSWQIIDGVGQYSSLQGSGSGSFRVVIVGKRAVASSAAFF